MAKNNNKFVRKKRLKTGLIHYFVKNDYGYYVRLVAPPPLQKNKKFTNI